MKLADLVDGICGQNLDPNTMDRDIPSLHCDSRKVTKDGLFVALQGATKNGSEFIPAAIEKGAKVIISNDFPKEMHYDDVYFLEVDDPKMVLRKLALRFYQSSSRKVKMIGITGTNGKTTVSYLLESILHEAEKSCGVIGTVNHRIGERIIPSVNTTPGFLDNQHLLNVIVEEGIEYCVMEVSSHALDQGRVDAIDFKTAVFTNLTSDHLDYHKTRENYFRAKTKLFSDLSADSHAIINVDDSYGRKLFSKCQARFLTYGVENNADVMAKDIQLDISGTQFKVFTREEELSIRSPLVGMFNVYNMLAAIATGLSEGISLEKSRDAIELFKRVPGRLERIDLGQKYFIFIDYAHTQDALENVLPTVKQFSDTRIILVFGCGGDRDKSKRSEMGKVAGQWADFSIVTSDNPRSERPEDIIDQIVEGFEKENYLAIVNREEAIVKALSMAKEGDIVLIAGKGHENIQIFKDRMITFDERQIIRQFILC